VSSTGALQVLTAELVPSAMLVPVTQPVLVQEVPATPPAVQAVTSAFDPASALLPTAQIVLV
jgi:hypothetical protein